MKDVCNCCDACAKQKGESCGGLWGMKGKCDKELRCLTTNSKFLFAIGICGRFFNFKVRSLLRDSILQASHTLRKRL